MERSILLTYNFKNTDSEFNWSTLEYQKRNDESSRKEIESRLGKNTGLENY